MNIRYLTLLKKINYYFWHCIVSPYLKCLLDGSLEGATTLSIMTFSIMMLNKMRYSAQVYSA